ncbi:uncharacterized protein LOC128202104 [Galleria mellonella]|uniref:Uncharacterized protein LOC128202104 n=1 Tax=Galleria mellonella TaxID=7137 RepID=A0ABM3N0S7_GALME|nr:uncharacterized protein LOC128202104 [Galleria mellonella]
MASSKAKDKYAVYRNFEKGKPDFKLNEELRNSIARDYRVLPLLEKKLYDHALQKYYSLECNEVLSCRWKHYADNRQGGRRTPFNFPKVEYVFSIDFHFYNYVNRYMPLQSVSNRAHYRLHLFPGPGVDALGQKPIPNDLQLRKTAGRQKKEKKGS